MCYQALIGDFAGQCQRILESRLTGVYLHGSLAMGCFNPDQSDIDLIVIVEGSIPDAQKISLMEQILRLNRMAPAKGLEISVVKRAYCKPFVYPTPFELHFSPKYLQWFHDDPTGYVNQMKGEDRDLAAHFVIINQFGVKVWGAAIADVFGPVPRKDYVDSILHDIENAPEEIEDNPLYCTLNLCRVLAYLKDGVVLSKEQGGGWGMAHLEEPYRALIQQAQQCYRSARTMRADRGLARQFADELLKRIKAEMNKS